LQTIYRLSRINGIELVFCSIVVIVDECFCLNAEVNEDLLKIISYSSIHNDIIIEQHMLNGILGGHQGLENNL
jgi:hypothetical protein